MKFGDRIVHICPANDAVKHVLVQECISFLEEIGSKREMDKVKFEYDLPWTYADEASGEMTTALQSTWSVDI